MPKMQFQQADMPILERITLGHLINNQAATVVQQDIFDVVHLINIYNQSLTGKLGHPPGPKELIDALPQAVSAGVALKNCQQVWRYACLWQVLGEKVSTISYHK